MNQPPKPLFDRLPAMPPRPSSKSNFPQVGREEAARKRLTTKLEAMSGREIEVPAVDPRTAAVASLMVANFVADEEVKKRFQPLVAAKLFDANALEDLPVAARFVLRILPKLGPELDQRGNAVPAELIASARGKREKLMRVVERYLADMDDAYGRLVTVRLGDTPADTIYDLRMLAGLCRTYAETLTAEAGSAYTPLLEREARDTAQRLEDVLIGHQTEEDREWRAYLLRALAMLVPLYDEVCRAGHFLFFGEKPEARFPSLAAVARVRRRLRRETARRIESTPGIPIAGPPSSKPESLPPEVSLVDVSDEEEQALAGALEAVPSAPMIPIAPAPIVNAHSYAPPPGPASGHVAAAAPEAAESHSYAPPPGVAAEPTQPSLKMAALAPSAPLGALPIVDATPPPSRQPALIDPIEAVTLDFGSSPSIAEDADTNLDTPDLDLELTYASESNFYSDLAGAEIGLFIATFVVKPPGTPLAIRLSVPQLDEPLVVSGSVHWVREFSPSIEAPPGMGVALRPIEGRARRAIDAFMKVRPPILHDE